MDMLKSAKALLPGEDENIINVYLDQAKQAILNRLYPFGSEGSEDPELPKRYESLAVRLTVYLCNKRGAEGETQHAESGVTRTYESSDIPESMLYEVTPRVKAYEIDGKK